MSDERFLWWPRPLSRSLKWVVNTHAIPERTTFFSAVREGQRWTKFCPPASEAAARRSGRLRRILRRLPDGVNCQGGCESRAIRARSPRDADEVAAASVSARRFEISRRPQASSPHMHRTRSNAARARQSFPGLVSDHRHCENGGPSMPNRAARPVRVPAALVSR